MHNKKRGHGRTAEQERGQILHERLTLINCFLVSDSCKGRTFGDLLRNNGMTEKEFLIELPEKYRFYGISKERQDSKKLADYGETLNLMEHALHMNHIIKTETEVDEDGHMAGNGYGAMAASGGDLSGAIITDTDAVFEDGDYNASGGRKRKRLKDRLKDKIKSSFDKTKDKLKGVKDKFKKQGLVGTLNRANPYFVMMRGAFNGLILLNFANLAYNFGRMKDANGKPWKKFLKKWRIFGGNETNLTNSVQKARGKKPLFAKRKSADGHYNVAGVDDAVALIAEATPALTLAFEAVKEFKKEKGEPDVPDENPDLPSVPPLDPDTDDALKGVGDDDDGGAGGIWDKYKTPIMIGIGVSIALGLIIAVVRGNKKS